MNIVIPYKDEVHKGLELRYALRSIEKNLKWFKSVVLIGDKPDWYKGEHIPAKDYTGRKEFSIYSKILTACEQTEITENFLFFNDDHYLLKPLTISEIKYWHNGLLIHELERRIGGRYRLVIQNTFELLGNGYPNNYDIHTPIIYNKSKFKELFQGLQKEVCIKSVYANQAEVQSEYMDDFKMDGDFWEDQIREKIKDKLFLSTGTCLCTSMVKVLGELFPNKSNFES